MKIELSDKLQDTFDRLLQKVLSARFWMAIIFSNAACKLTLYSVENYKELDRLAVIIVTAFTNIVSLVVGFYFAAKSRPQENPLKEDK